MKLRITSLLCIFLAIACSTEEVEINETETLETISLNQKIVDQLNADGYEAIVTDNDKVVSTGFKDPEEFTLKLNEIFDDLSESHRKFELNNSTNQNKSVQCESSDIYQSGDEWCVNYVCWGGSEISVIADVTTSDGTNFVFWTSCS